MFQQKLVDNRGRPIVLSKEVGRGGEGAVFEIQGSPSLVAKIYSKIPDHEKAAKISTMIGMGNERLLKLAAWPINSIHSTDNRLVGFTMHKLTDHQPISNLYNPKQRLQAFPTADWRFLIHAASNTARAFSVIHEFGQVIGDVNHGNLQVTNDATVNLIDTDSFQIFAKGNYWFCEVGVPTHQPPEMQNQSSYKGITRTQNHDNFGLAVLIFQLLCLGRHPFSGRYSGAGEMPLEKAISEFRYAYAADQAYTRMSPPPVCLPMRALTPTVRSYFERAFSKDSCRWNARPSPKDWVDALTELASKLKQCSVNLAHYLTVEMPSCPWCEIEVHCNDPLFPVIQPKANNDIDISLLWQKFLNIQAPIDISALPDIESRKTPPSNNAVLISSKLKKYRHNATAAFTALVIVGCGLVVVGAIIGSILPFIGMVLPVGAIPLWGFYEFKKETLTGPIWDAFDSKRSKWHTVCGELEHQKENGQFRVLRTQINALKGKYDLLDRERQDRLQKILNNVYALQLKRHLSAFRIATAAIEGIGEGRIATLQSYSIETAADIDSATLTSIGGFGQVLAARLLEWKKTCEYEFVFDPKKGVPPHEVAVLDHDIAGKRRTIATELSKKISQLSALTETTNADRRELLSRMNEILSDYCQAMADAKEVELIVSRNQSWKGRMP